MNVKPRNGGVAVRCIDDPDECCAEGAKKACLCLVVGADPKTGLKEGDTVFCSPFACRDALLLDDKVRLLDGWSVLASVTK